MSLWDKFWETFDRVKEKYTMDLGKPERNLVSDHEKLPTINPIKHFVKGCREWKKERRVIKNWEAQEKAKT